MKYVPVIVILCAVSSCIKVENLGFADCGDKPAKPVLSANNFTKQLGESISLSVTNYETDVSYYWYSPEGEKVGTGRNETIFLNSSTYTGQFTVKGVKGYPPCEGESSTFTVNLTSNMPSCGMSYNTFKLGNSINTLWANTGYTDPDFNGLPTLFCSLAGSSSLSITLRSLPKENSIKVYTVRDGYPSDSSKCRMIFNFSGSYNANSGLVYIQHVPGQYNVAYCNVNFYRVSDQYQHPNSKADLHFDD